MYDARIGRFLSIDPLAAQYPWNSPYAFAGNSPIKFLDRAGLRPDASSTDPPGRSPWVRLTNANFVAIMNDAGFSEQWMGRLPFNKLKGGLLEALFLDVAWPSGMPRNPIHFRSHKPGYSVRPDGVAPAVGIEWNVGGNGKILRKVTPYSNSVFIEVKAIKGSMSRGDRVIRNTRQIKGMIHALADIKQNGVKASEISAATLIIVAFEGVKIHDNVLNEARNKNVNLFVVRPEYNEETGKFRFTSPEPLVLREKTGEIGPNGQEFTLTPAVLNGWAENERTTSFQKLVENAENSYGASLAIPHLTNEDGTDGESDVDD